jgi:hypothetical protein
MVYPPEFNYTSHLGTWQESKSGAAGKMYINLARRLHGFSRIKKELYLSKLRNK